MLIRAVIDIDPSDPVIRELNELAFSFGIVDMTEVLVLTKLNKNFDFQKMVMVDLESFIKVIQVILAIAIMNFASWKFESYEVALPATTKERPLLRFFRTYPAETHRDLANGYLAKAKEIIVKNIKVDGEIAPA